MKKLISPANSKRPFQYHDPVYRPKQKYLLIVNGKLEEKTCAFVDYEERDERTGSLAGNVFAGIYTYRVVHFTDRTKWDESTGERAPIPFNPKIKESD